MKPRRHRLLAVGHGPDEAPISAIINQFRRSSQFCTVDTMSRYSPTNSQIGPAREADMLLIGLETALSKHGWPIAVSRCPCVFWVPEWNSQSANDIALLGARHRTRLVVTGTSPKKGPNLSSKVRMLSIDLRSDACNAAFAIIGALQDECRQVDFTDMTCPC